jgi:hypothetical protein
MYRVPAQKITGILTKFQKKNPTGIFGIEHRIGIPLTMGVPEIGTKNRNSQPSNAEILTIALQISCVVETATRTVQADAGE